MVSLLSHNVRPVTGKYPCRSMRGMVFLPVFLLCLSPSIVSDASQPVLDAHLDRHRIRLGEAVNVLVRISGEKSKSVGAIVVPDLAGRFKIVDQGIKPGGDRLHPEYFFQLQPLLTGEITVPGFGLRAGGKQYTSKPLPLTVLPPIPMLSVEGGEPLALSKGFVPSEAGLDDRIFLLAVTDNLEPFVGEQVVAEYRVYSKPAVLRGNASDMPRFEGFTALPMKIAQSELDWSHIVIAKSEYMAKPLARFTLFPLQDGNLRIPVLSYTFEVAPDFDSTGNVERVRRSSRPVELHVKPLPDQGKPKGFFEYNVGRFEVGASLSKQDATLGEPVKLRIIVKGRGNISLVRIPEPRLSRGLKLLSPISEKKIAFIGLTAMGSKTWEYNVLPKATGHAEICNIKVDYFDPREGAYDTSVAPCLDLDIRDRTENTEPATGMKHTAPLRLTEGSGQAECSSRLYGRPWFWILLFLAPLPFILSLIISRRPKIKGDKKNKEKNKYVTRAGGRSPGSIKDVAHRRLSDRGTRHDENVNPRAIRKLILDTLEESLSIPARGLTREEVSKLAQEAGLEDDRVQELYRLMADCEQAICDPSFAYDPAELRSRAELVREFLLSAGKKNHNKNNEVKDN
ncbi:MAG: protein BatD [Deltaproteobacteria bacterium]|nr:protein BatD [Deltaproteobacteria bacterium]